MSIVLLPRPRRHEPVEPLPAIPDSPRRQSATTILLSFVTWHGAARGLYRVFGPAVYRFYRSNSAPPAEGDSPFATSATLPDQPANPYADGTWYVSVSYFVDGVIDSGFLPPGTAWRNLCDSGNRRRSCDRWRPRPSQPLTAALTVMPGGAIRITATYVSVVDGENAATQWAINYTTNGSAPASGAASLHAGDRRQSCWASSSTICLPRPMAQS